MSFSAEIMRASALLRQGELVAFPTETVYGLGADATNDQAVARIYAAKQRPSFNPLIAHVASLAQAETLVEFSPLAQKLAEAFWPGPLTLVLPQKTSSPVSALASAGLTSLAVRVPAHPLALQLLQAVARPIVAPSANPSGQLSPTSAEHVRQHLNDKVSLILDGGPCRCGLESTIINLLTPEPVLLRAGGISRAELEEVLGNKLMAAGEPSEAGAAPIAPGQLASHYAPKAALRLNATAPQDNEIFLGFGEIAHGPYNLSPHGDLTEAAANLFRLLHLIDAENASLIAVAPIPDQGLGEAINDRLKRAAAPRP